MRNGKKPTRKQKIRLGQAGLAPENWLVIKQKEYRAEATSRAKKKAGAGDEFLGKKADDALARLRAINE